MAFIPVAYLMVASTALAAASAIQQGKVASANSQSQANISDYNAKVASNNATTARQQAGANEEAQRRQAAIQLGRQRAGTAQAGGGLDGTSGDLYAQSLQNVDLDAKNILYQGDLRGQGLDSESTLQTAGASQYRSNASTAISGSYLSAAGAAFSGAGNYYKTSALMKAGNPNLA